MKHALRTAVLLCVAGLSTAAIAAASYRLQIDAPAAQLSKQTVAKVRILPGAGYHVNVDYPARLTLHAPDGVTLATEKMTAKDAAKLDASTLEFDAVYTAATKGKKEFSGELKFAVCTADNCEPHVEHVAFGVDVK